MAGPPSPAMVVALVALSSSLASGAMAAKLLTGKDIANRSITGKDLKASSVTSKHVKNRSLVTKDFKKGHLLFGQIGPVGPEGPEGPRDREGDRPAERRPGAARGARPERTARMESTAQTGRTAPTGRRRGRAPGATNVVIRHGTDANIQNSTVITTSVDCNAGERAVGGGGTNDGAAGVHLKQSNPTPATQGATPTGWAVTHENLSGGPADPRVGRRATSP